MKMPLAISLCTVTLVACSIDRHNESSLAGAPHDFSLLCEGDGGDRSFRIYEGQGLLTEYGKDSVKFHCEQIVGLDDEIVSGSMKRLWFCSEADHAHGYEVSVYQSGGASQVNASVTSNHGTDELALLSCQR